MSLEKIKQLEDEIKKVIPSILDLKMGCNVYCQDALEDEFGQLTDSYGVYCDGKGLNTEVIFNTEGGKILIPASIDEVLGRDITLEDVLVALFLIPSEKFLHNIAVASNGAFIEVENGGKWKYLLHKKETIKWKLNTPLHLQSKEIIDFLWSLIYKK